MVNTSSTGGYLSPTSTTLPLEGDALQDFIHDVVVGITGLDPKLVRPRWLSEPANIPDAGVAWCAVGVLTRPSDTFPYQKSVNDDGNVGSVELQRHERLNIIASFYDLGSGGKADGLAALLRDGFSVSQNREQLQLNGWAFVSCEEPTPVPSLLKERWLYRCDLPFQLRRAIVRTYPIENLLSAEGVIETQNQDLTLNFQSQPEKEQS